MSELARRRARPDAPPVLLHVALMAEAKPLIGHFGLRSETPVGGFRVYSSDWLALIVSGMGKLSAAAASAYLYGWLGSPAVCAWLNVGAAGHATCPLGEARIAHTICDGATGSRWYPPQIWTHPWAAARLMTVERAEHSYGEDCLYDMEAAGFYATATRFTTAELVQSCKIVSDNARQPAAHVTARHVTELIARQLPVIAHLIEELHRLADELTQQEDVPSEYFELTAHWRFTVSERQRLKRVVQRWRALTGTPCTIASVASLQRGSEVLKALNAHLDGFAGGQGAS